MKRKLPTYKAIKYNGDDLYSWAVFNYRDVVGYRSPITSDMTDRLKIKPLVSGCSQTEARYYIKQLVKEQRIKNG